VQSTLAPIRPKGLTRWFTRHALGRIALEAGLRRGEIYPRLVLDESLREDPYPFYAKIREQGDLVPGNFAHATARHAMVGELLKHPDLNSGMPLESAPKPVRTMLNWAMEPEVLSPVDPPSMLVTDGPGHLKARKAVSRAFTPRAIADLDVRVHEIAEELLDGMAKKGPHADLVLDYAEVLPVRVIAEILGVPIAMMATFRGWGHDLAVSLDFGRNYTTMRRAEAAMLAMNAWFREHFAALRRNPGDDLLSRMIVAADADADPLSEIELVSIAGLVLAAGFETTVNLMGNGSHLLFRHPEQLEELRARPEGWRNAIEEMLRFDPPAQNTVRHTTKDLEIAGHRIPRGKFLVVIMAGANRDPAVFDDPDRFDVTRANAKEHISFGAGSHYCLGAALSRMEGEIGLRKLFERFPDLRATAAPTRRPARLLRGFASMPIQLTAQQVSVASRG
jgi:cytochrome P450